MATFVGFPLFGRLLLFGGDPRQCPCRVVLPSFELCVAHTCGVAPALLCIPHMCVLSSRILTRTVDALPPRPATPPIPPPTSRLTCIRDLPVFVCRASCASPAPLFSHSQPVPNVANVPGCATVHSVRLAVGYVRPVAPVANHFTHHIYHFSFLISRDARTCSLCSPRSTLFPLLDQLGLVVFYRFTQNGFSFLAPRERFPGSIPHLNVFRPALAGITTRLLCMYDGCSCL